MSEARAASDFVLHRDWPRECVLVRAADPANLAAALDEARDLLAREAELDLAVAARAITERAAGGALTVAIVAESLASLAARLERASASLAAGVETISEDGLHYQRHPPRAGGPAIWLFAGGEAVSRRMLQTLALRLPGFVAAFDRAAAASDDPAAVAEFLFGPHEAPALEATTRARLALAAGRAMADWLLRLLPPPQRALGGPGAEGPWLDSRRLRLEDFDDCDLAAVAAPSRASWDEVLARLPAAADALVIHAGPGAPPAGRQVSLALLPAGVDELRGLLEGLAWLAARGLPVDTTPLFDCRGVPAKPATPAMPPRRQPFVFQPRSPRFDPTVVTRPARASTGKAASAPLSGSPVAIHAPAAIQAPTDAAAAPRPRADIRTEIVLEHLETMRQVLDQQQRTVQRFYGTPASPSPTVTPHHGPMVHQIRELVPGIRLLATARYDVEEAVFLKQHTPNVSAVSQHDRHAFGLPVMPLTFSMEALAEAAVLLAPGRVVTALEQLEARNWMSFEKGAVEARITAEVDSGGRDADGRDPADPDRVVVAARLLDAHDPKRVFLSGRVVLGTSYPPAPRAPEWRVPDAISCGWTAADVYPRRGFHGPLLQAITGVDQHGAAGMTGELTVLPRAPLFASGAEPDFELDPVLLDSLGMGVGIWTWREAMNGVYPVPVRVGRVRLYGPPLPPGEVLRMEVRVSRNADGMIAADLAAVRADGALHVAVEEWEDYVYRLPLSVHRLAADPFGQSVATPVPLPDSGSEWNDLEVRQFPALPGGLLTAAEGIWEKILAWFWLSPAERDEWWALGADTRRRHRWLAERATLKEAARRVLATPRGIPGAYDVAVRTTPDGRPAADGVALAAATLGERTLAAAGREDRGSLAIELLPAALEPAAAEAGLSTEERLRLRDLGDDWPARAWAAKTAAARALGEGPGGESTTDPRALRLGPIDGPSGRIRLIPTGAWTRIPGAPTELDALTVRHGDEVIAVCRV